MKVASIVGARPQFVKAAPVSRELRMAHTEILIHTGQHYDDNMSDAFFRALRIPKPDRNLGIGSGTHGQQTGRMLEALDGALREVDPDVALVYGDSVPGWTPIMVRRSGLAEILPIEDLFPTACWSGRSAPPAGLEVWTDEGWRMVRYVYRHSGKRRGFRIRTAAAVLDVTEDHSLVIDGQEVNPSAFKIGDQVALNPYVLNGEMRVPPELAWTLGLFAAEGTCGIYRNGRGHKYSWYVCNQDPALLQRCIEPLWQYMGFRTKVIRCKDNLHHLLPYNGNRPSPYGIHRPMADLFSFMFLTRDGHKKVPSLILNASREAQVAFIEGYLAGDGWVDEYSTEFCSVDPNLVSGLVSMYQRAGFAPFMKARRRDKPHIFSVRISRSSRYEMNEIIALEPIILDGYVYDLETENHHFVAGIGGMVAHNTNSTLAGALAAAKLQMPLGHVESGLRSYNRTMPEEINRVIADHVANLLLCPTDTAVRNLRREGITSDVHLVGDVMYDVALQSREAARKRGKVEALGLDPNGYLLVTVHRPSNTDNAANLKAILTALGRSKEVVVFPIHPRTRAAIALHKLRAPENVRLLDPLDYLDFLDLLLHARRVITDSGGVQKEAFFAGVPCLTLRDETEWPETIADGWNTLVGTDPDRILKALKAGDPGTPRGDYFGDGHAARRIREAMEAHLRR